MKGAESARVKGWSLSGIVRYQSGSPLTATDSINAGLNGISIGRKASIVPGQFLSFSGTCSNTKALGWFNPNAFAAETTLGAGDAPINDLIGPSFCSWDLTLRKTFALREGMSIQLQGDAFNAFNHTSWNNPTVNDAGSSSFGQITGSLPVRVVQLGGKFIF